VATRTPFYDPDAEYPEDWEWADIVREQMQRAANLQFIGEFIKGWKGRLSEAGRQAIARDRKQARAVVAAATLSMAEWSRIGKAPVVDLDPPMSHRDARKKLAPLVWDDLIDETLLPALNRDAVKVVSWAVDGGDPSLGNQAAWRFTQDIRAMQRIRDM
jgi:predicted polyphosphate/ATP-dependent NAD kinase